MTGHPDWADDWLEPDDGRLLDDDTLTGCLRVLGVFLAVVGVAFLVLFVWVAVVG